MHSALFFLLFILVILGIPMAGLMLFLPAIVIFDILGREPALFAHLPLVFMGVMLLCSAVVGPFVCFIFWADIRLKVRINKIMAGGGWSGSGVDEVVQACLAQTTTGTVSPDVIKKRRRKLWWQIPLNIALVIASGILLDAVITPEWLDENKGLGFFGVMIFYGIAIIWPLFWLLKRADLLTKAVYLPVVAKNHDWRRSKNAKPPAAAAPRFGNAPADIHDYTQITQNPAQKATPPAKPALSDEQYRLKNLRRNLWWQLPLLLPLSLLLIWLSLEPVFLTPFQLLQSRPTVEISTTGIVFLFMGAVLIPAWLIKWILFASSAAKESTQKRWQNIAEVSGFWLIPVVVVSFLLLPVQFLVMPELDYVQCDKQRFSKGNPGAIPLPLPVTWVKSDQAQAGWCAKTPEWHAHEIKYGDIAYQHVCLHVYERGKARLISDQGQWEITSQQGAIAREILQYWNLYTWIRMHNSHGYRRLAEDEERYRTPYDMPKNVYQLPHPGLWRHPMDSQGTLLEQRFRFGYGFEKKIETGVLRRDYEKIKHEIKNLAELKKRLPVFEFSRDQYSDFKAYPIRNESLDFTGYGCLHVRLLRDEKNDLKTLLNAVLHTPENCTQNPALAALEPRLAPPPKPADLLPLPEHALRQYVWLHVYERGKARIISAQAQWEVHENQGRIAQNILPYWNLYTWRREPYTHGIQNLPAHEKSPQPKALVGAERVNVVWQHPMAENHRLGFKMWELRYRTGRSFEQPIYTGVKRSDYEKIKHNINSLREAAGQLPTYQFSPPGEFNPQGYPVTDESLDYTGYGCLYAQLRGDEASGALQEIIDAELRSRSHCLKEAPPLAALEPKVPAPPGAGEMITVYGPGDVQER